MAAGMSLLGVAGCGRTEGTEGSAAPGPPTGGESAAVPADGATAPPSGTPSAPGSGAPSAPGAPSASGTPSGRPAGSDRAPASASAGPSAQAAPRVPVEAEGRPVLELNPERRVVALTLDDGPDPKHTPTVLALLEKHGIRATFFLVGENVAAHPGLVREIADRGHHIANHTWSHPDLRQLSESRVREELERTSDLLHRATGRAPTWFRAPGGDWSSASLKVSAALGMRPMGWSVDPRDWARPGTAVITERVLKDIRPGSIVLNHDGGGDRSQTVAALQAYLPVLIDAGYYFTAPPS
ncbi:polysaccharide deacetylase family protein [Kitasatospora sp. NPDC054939]